MRIRITDKKKTIPIMGKEAFLAFAKEYSDLIKGEGLKPHISIPCMSWYERYGGQIGTNYKDVYFQFASLRGRVDVVEGDTIRCRRSGIYDISNQTEQESLAKFETSDNFGFYDIARNSNEADVYQKARELIPEELVTKVRELIFKRSALIQRGLFGGRISI